eukprot:4972456-Prorocentrum_lima.AAC.1
MYSDAHQDNNYERDRRLHVPRPLLEARLLLEVLLHRFLGAAAEEEVADMALMRLVRTRRKKTRP